MINIFLLIGIILGVLIILGLIIIFLLRMIKKRKKFKENVPKEIMVDFQRAEQLREEYKGSKTPQEILYQVWKERNNLPTIEEIENVDTPSFPLEKELKKKSKLRFRMKK